MTNLTSKTEAISKVINQKVLQVLKDQLETPSDEVGKKLHKELTGLVPPNCLTEDIANNCKGLLAALHVVKQQLYYNVEKQPIIDFISHINSHINNMPVGGWTEDWRTEVKITIGGKTLVFYDHAYLIGGINQLLEDLIDEL